MVELVYPSGTTGTSFKTEDIRIVTASTKGIDSTTSTSGPQKVFNLTVNLAAQLGINNPV